MYLQGQIIILDDVLTVTECDQLINYYKSTGHTFEWGGAYPLSLTKRELHSSEEMQFAFSKAVKIQQVINQFIDQKVSIDWCEITKWPPRSSKGKHTDFASEITIFTSVTYLNDDYSGGETFFTDGTKVAPKTGRTIYFDGQYYEHGVNEVQNKDRYTLPIWYK